MAKKDSKNIQIIEEWTMTEDEIDYTAKPIISKNPAKTMSVMQMGKILGLHKTDSYWLAHKEFFKIIEVAGRMRVDIESFENWYKHQIKYKKIDGTPPGELLKMESYSARDIAKILQISEERVYSAMKRDNVPYIIVDYWKRWEKSTFEEWYESQSRYRTQEDHKNDLSDIERTISMPEISFLLGVHRNTVYNLVYSPKTKNFFELITVANQKRITKESFLKWYNSQNKYVLLYDSIEDGQKEKISTVKKSEKLKEQVESSMETKDILEELRHTSLSNISSNPNYYSIDEVVDLLGKKRKAVLKMIRKNIIPSISIANSYRIPKLEFDRWIIENQSLSEGECKINGICG